MTEKQEETPQEKLGSLCRGCALEAWHVAGGGWRIVTTNSTRVDFGGLNTLAHATAFVHGYSAALQMQSSATVDLRKESTARRSASSPAS